MHSGVFSRMLVAVLAGFAVCYAVYMAVRFFSPDYQTETAFSYVIADSSRIRAVAVRDEQVITSSAQGVYAYLRDDGDVVLSSTTIANVYQGQSDLVREEQCRRWENEIAILQSAQNAGQQNVIGDTLAADVADAAGAIVDSTVCGDLSNLSAQRDRLQLLLGRRLINSGKVTDFSPRISQLDNLITSARAQMSSAAAGVTAGVAGYFCSTTDGFETVLSPDLEVLTASAVRGVAEGTTKPLRNDSAVGKVQKGFRWYLAAALDEKTAQQFTEGAAVTLDFGVTGATDIPARVKLVRREDNLTLVVLEIERLSRYLINLRVVPVEVKFRSFSGLRISREAIRYIGQTEGVYVKSGNLVVFKPIVRVYEDETSVLCADSSNLPNSLEQFDEVIVRGKDLYDGKIIQ